MEAYRSTFDRMAWELICSKIAEKSQIGSIYGRSCCIIMQPRGYGKTMTSRALFGSIMNNFSEDFDKNSISIRWCEYFEIPNDRGRKNRLIYMAKIERYLLPKTRFRG